MARQRSDPQPIGPADPRNRRQPTGCVLWQGPSRFDGGPAVVVLTFRSENVKTGDMAQAWILRADTHPVEASARGLDGSVCVAGARRCIHAGIPSVRKNGQPVVRESSCYVSLAQGPRAVWDAYRRGLYPDATATLLRRHVSGRAVRLGAYGDPCGVPLSVWTRLLRHASAHTGYTQQWRWTDCQPYRFILMASVHSTAELTEARERGWRCFRDRLATDPIAPGEIVCPATPEGRYRRQCGTCLACDGFHRPGQADVVTVAHGSPPVMRTVVRNLERAGRGAEGIVWK